MNLSFIESLLDKVVKPDRVEIKLLDRKFLLIQSAENTNDTIGWFHINSQALENEFEANNLLEISAGYPGDKRRLSRR